MLKAYYSDDTVEAGCDEAGRGCLAGPVVAAAVILPRDYHHPLLNDSKQLNKLQREALRTEIKRDAICWSVAEVSNQEIDEINILNASFLAMHRALDLCEVRPEFLIIDGNRFNSYREVPHQCIVEGDAKYYSIAAASILAKTHRDDLMCELSRDFPHYGWDTNVGYPTTQHRAAIKAHGICRHHRLSFRLLPGQLELFEEDEGVVQDTLPMD